MNKTYFALTVHSHQPVGNFDHVIEEAYQKSYRPFLEVLVAHPQIRFCLHTSGVLLEWIEKHHPEFFKLLGQMVDRSQVELLGGGYYEPILVSIPEPDRMAQIRRMADYLNQHFGVRPKGAWVAERVWEQNLTRSLADAGVEYVILDDSHFLAAGLDPSELHGAFITEEGGVPLRLVPSLKSLRYSIPFSDPEETLRVLRSGQIGPAPSISLFAVGDDCEKFGVWPGTHEHVYKNKWLERFLTQIELAGDWLQTITLSDYLAQHPPHGRVYLPTASYEEMMEWALPTAASREFKTTQEEIGRMPYAERIRRFLRGGMWPNFLAKYSESNQLHKLMLDVSRRWHAASQKGEPGTRTARLLAEAQTHLLASQCNDAYWHGIFGGLYAPHLRSALLRNLIQAEALLDKVEATSETSPLRIESRDFDVDGQPEFLVDHPTFAMVVRPADGGTISSLRFKPADADLINALMRRQEAYHDQVLRQVAEADKAPREGPSSIHERVWSKESNLSTLLRYDRYTRNIFRTYLFPAAKQCDDFDYLRLEETTELASGAWTVKGSSPARLTLERPAHVRLDGKSVPLHASKTIEIAGTGASLRLDCRLSLTAEPAIAEPLALGTELVFNLLAPDAPDRYFLANEVRRPLEFNGEVIASRLVIVDEWQRVRISMEANPQPRWWIVPIETISQSESGFERVYQGSAILAVWKIEPASWHSMTGDLSVEIEYLGGG
ncbi:MAG: alpha-amylase/4-alpha-glucanotransferase domain-containing protein [Terriglobia bacterium]